MAAYPASEITTMIGMKRSRSGSSSVGEGVRPTRLRRRCTGGGLSLRRCCSTGELIGASSGLVSSLAWDLMLKLALIFRRRLGASDLLLNLQGDLQRHGAFK